MPESIFTLLFRYRPALFDQGELVWLAGGTLLLVVALLALLGVAAAVAGYRRYRHKLGSRRIAALTALRAATLLVAGLILLRPALRVSTVIPGENFLAILVDDSRSMSLPGAGDASRGDQATSALIDPTSDVVQRLSERFTLRYFRFAGDAGRHDAARPLGFGGPTTDIAGALEFMQRELAGVPLAGAVLATDGASNADTSLTETLLRLKASRVPVYTVGLGPEAFARDIEVVRVEGPDQVLQGSTIALDVVLDQAGYGGTTIPLVVEQNGAIARTEEVEFARGNAGTVARVYLTATEPGETRLSVTVPNQAGEEVTQNNSRDHFISVVARPEKVLYFEGEPRFEVKFLRHAVADDPNLQLVVLQRTAENKYLRLGVDDETELLGGFPKTREELFSYRGLIIGSVEASFFTHDQLRIIEDFVAQRGGGVLFLGGRRAFAEGGYRDTPLENVMPVILGESTAEASERFFRELRVAPTEAGYRHAFAQLQDSEEASRERWNTLPALTSLNPVVGAKAAATVLLSGRGTDDDQEQVVLAWHRYGRGKAIAWVVQDTWLWQMHADIPLEDQTHERLWRQMLRWLVSDVPEPVTAEVDRRQAAPGEVVAITAEVADSGFLGINGADVRATVTDPTGNEFEVPLEWAIEEDGAYRGSFVPAILGDYQVSVTADYHGATVGQATTSVEAADLPREFFDAEMHAPLLRQIARETGGRFYTTENVSGLPEDARFTESGHTVTEHYDLWHMPVVLAALLLLLAGEWSLRRGWGLA